MNILYGNNRGKKKLYESFLDDVNERILDNLPEDLPPDDETKLNEDGEYEPLTELFGKNKSKPGHDMNDPLIIIGSEDEIEVHIPKLNQLENAYFLNKKIFKKDIPYWSADEVKDSNGKAHYVLINGKKNPYPDTKSAVLLNVIELKRVGSYDVGDTFKISNNEYLIVDQYHAISTFGTQTPGGDDNIFRLLGIKGPALAKTYSRHDPSIKLSMSESIAEDTVKQGDKWVNKGKEGINEGATKDPAGLGAELEEIEDLYNEFGPEGFYGVKFSNFLEEFPIFGKEVLLAFITEMEIRSPEEMEDEETLETDWATGELIIKEDWPCILDGAHRMVNGRGKNNKHNVQWEKIWKNYYKSYDESFNK